MKNSSHVLISLDERHAENIFSGRKQVELRRRTMNVENGTTVWVYVKQPTGAIVGKFTVSASFSLTPRTLWEKFSAISGLTRTEFFDYFEGLSKGFAIGVTSAEKLNSPISLGDLRKVAPCFHPPQFFKRLNPDNVLLQSVQGRKVATS